MSLRPRKVLDQALGRDLSKENAECSPIHPTSAVQAKKLLTFDELPTWRQDNAFILTGYRLAPDSFAAALLSVWEIHNETVNIHTHLLPGVIFLLIPLLYGFQISMTALGWPFRASVAPSSMSTSISTILPFYLGAAICLLGSALFHSTSHVSQPTATRLNRADYLGIVTLVSGSAASSLIFAFRCQTILRDVYLIALGCLSTFCAALAALHPRFASSEWRRNRAAIFVGFGLTAICPVAHGLAIYGWHMMCGRGGLAWLIGQGVLYILGACIYAARIPERWFPKRFDILGSSHQVFHVLVVVAACTHFTGLLKAAENARAEPC